MNQKEVGSFISKLRKEQGLTQAALGAKIGVTNKTVSRWENGDYMPDIGIMSNLCEELGITVNELISGKKLEAADYEAQAEKNLVWTLKELNYLKKTQRIADALGSMGVGLLASLLMAPDSTRKILMFFIALVIICIGWYERSKYDKIVLGERDDAWTS